MLRCEQNHTVVPDVWISSDVERAEIECLPHLYRAYSESLDDRLVGKNVTKMIEAEG